MFYFSGYEYALISSMFIQFFEGITGRTLNWQFYRIKYLLNELPVRVIERTTTNIDRDLFSNLFASKNRTVIFTIAETLLLTLIMKGDGIDVDIYGVVLSHAASFHPHLMPHTVSELYPASLIFHQVAL